MSIRWVRMTFGATVTRAGLIATILAAAALAAMLGGCRQDAIDANQRQIQDQQAQLDQMKQEIEALKNQRPTYSTAPPPAGGCDSAVMSEATRKGGERMAAGDTSAALGYYQDAVTACPTSAQAQLNLAHSYETTGDRAAAVEHYRIAASTTGTDADAGAIQKAKDALSRMGSPS
jgi:tetratricopeptide (TPR) repeat protein